MTKGYYYDTNKGLYHVRVYRNGVNYHVGRFSTQQEAERKRREFIRDYRVEEMIEKPISSTDSLSRILNSNHYMIVRTHG